MLNCVMLILAIGLGLPSFLSLVAGYTPGSSTAFAATTVGTSAAIAAMGIAFQKYGNVEALLFVLLAGAIGIGVIWLVPRIMSTTLAPLLSLAFLLSYHSAI